MPQGPLDVAEEALRISPDIDLLVCNAGTFIDQPFLDMDFGTFDRTLKLNVYSQYVLIQHFARLWVRRGIRGRVLLIGSINGRLAEPTHVAYDTSKGAIDAMTRSLCVALAPHGIRVNGMAPGLFVTPLTAPALQNPRARQWMELHTPNGVVPNADACRGAAVFLLSDAAEHIHGQMLLVDGGMSVWQQPDPPEEWMMKRLSVKGTRIPQVHRASLLQGSDHSERTDRATSIGRYSHKARGAPCRTIHRRESP